MPDDDDFRGEDDFNPERNRLAAPVSELLAGAEQMFLLRLDPFRRPRAGREFHSWRVTRRIQLRSSDDRTAVAGVVESGLATSDGSSAACFDPTIGVRARRGADWLDFVCCFDCNWIRVFAEVGEQPFRALLLTARSPEGLLLSMLRRS